MALTKGTKLGPYEVVGALGAGGMGEVYRAQDTKLGREVALKVLPEEFAANTERMARFEREAKVLASLNHPNIAAIHGFEESGGGRALVMELVPGETLAERIATGAIPADEALPIARQIAEGLEYAHERGIVHRDLKPANVKITPEGTVKLLDFGLAKALEGDGATATDPSSSPTMSRLATQAGIILGTAAYMAPEQAKGKPVDRRADIWAFGCVLYEMLTGKKPFDGDTVTDILAAVVKDEPDWTALPGHAPPAIQRLTRRCLTKDSKQRLQAIGEARIAIDESLSGGTPQAVESPGSPAPIWRRVLPWAAAGILACLGAFGGWWLGARRAAPATQHRAMHFSAVTDFAGVQAEPAISPDGRSVAFVSNRDGHFNIYVGLVSGGSLIQITHDSNLESRPSWSPDGATIAYARLNHWGQWDVWEVPALGGTPRRVILNAFDPTWSPDGHSLAFTNLSQKGYGGIWISGVSGESAHQVVAPWRVQGWVIGLDAQPRFSPDGRQLAFIASSADGGPGSMLAVADLESGKTRFLTRGRAMARSPAWSPLGRFIYFASSRGGTVNIWKISASGGDPLQVTAGEGDDADVDVSKDGKEIVFGTIRQKVGIARLDLRAKPGQQEPKALTTDPARNQLAPVYSPDGKHLAYFTSLKGVENEEIWVSDADGSNAEALAQDARINIFPAWTPDSKALIYSSLNVRGHGARKVIYRRVALSGGAPQTLLSIPFWSMVDVGRDGRLLYLGAKSVAEAFDPRTGKNHGLGMLPGTVPWKPLLWSPDEHAVAYMVMPTKADDPRAGLWVDDFRSPPRQIYHGWVIWFARGPGNELYLLQGNSDLNAVLWKVNWDGQALTRTHWTVPILYNANYHHTLTDALFDVSPDGRYLAFQTDQVLEENIGMIENAR